MKTYRTAEIAALIGIHPNTVRFYEGEGLLPPVPREENGYRIYSERHLLGLKLIRCAFRAEILSSNLRNEAADIIRTSASGRHRSAVQKAKRYRAHLLEEIGRAREAIRLTEQILNKDIFHIEQGMVYGRRDAAAQIGISMDVLRDWERNGLIEVPRAGKRRQYGTQEMNRLKIIFVLRSAHYSQTAVRRMLKKLDSGEFDLLAAIDTPEPTEDIVSVADRYITSLQGAVEDSVQMRRLLKLLDQTLQ